MNKQLRGRWSLPRLVVIGTILILVIWKVNFQMFLSHLSWKLGIALLWVQPIIMIGLVLHAFRLVLLLDLPLRSFWHALKALLLSQGGNLFLPARLSEILKVAYLHAHADVQVSRGIAAVILERAVDLLIFGLIAAGSVALYATGRAGVSAILVAAIGVTSVVLAPWITVKIAPVVKTLGWLRLAGLVEETGKNLRQSFHNPRFLGAMLLGILTWTTSICTVVLFLLALPYDIGLQSSLALFVGTTIAGALPALPGGFGIYEAAAVLILKPLGIDFTEALAIGLILHIAFYIIPCIGAALIIMTERSGVSKLMKKFQK